MSAPATTVVLVQEPEFTTVDLILAVVAFFIPPVAVIFKRGCTVDFWLNLLLTILGLLPGVLHAWWVIYKHRGNGEYSYQQISQV
ncbi:plasma membrane proteolipid Pmp3 [Nowakowskiella sp. JEL0407]|nr:plasma membrane proteolipid Pmp3 [Nowakowskiella sp. JEL0407]